MAQFDETERKSGLDPTFFLPPNVLDLRYTESENADDGGEEVVDSSTDVPPVDSAPEISENGEFLTPEAAVQIPIPDGITVVSQTTRSPAGGYVVDVVINVPDIPGVENFDVQVAKV
jgi:hypothetical protein